MLCFLFILFIALGSQPGYGLYFNSPSVLEPRKADLSLAPYISFDHEGGVFLINHYGLLKDLNTVVKTGWVRTGSDHFYIGAELKYLLWDRFGGTDNFTLTAGGHYAGNAGMDLAACLGNEFRNFEGYIGLDFDLEWTGGQMEYPGDFVVGVKSNVLTGKHYLVLETGIPVTSFSSYKLGLSFILTI